MAQHYTEIIGVSFLLIFLATMTYHGIMIMKQHNGYSQRYIRRDSQRMRTRIEEILKDDNFD